MNEVQEGGGRELEGSRKPKNLRLKIRLEKLQTRNTREISLVLILYSTEPDSIAWPHAKNRKFHVLFFILFVFSSSAAVACFLLTLSAFIS